MFSRPRFVRSEDKDICTRTTSLELPRTPRLNSYHFLITLFSDVVSYTVSNPRKSYEIHAGLIFSPYFMISLRSNISFRRFIFLPISALTIKSCLSHLLHRFCRTRSFSYVISSLFNSTSKPFLSTRVPCLDITVTRLFLFS